MTRSDPPPASEETPEESDAPPGLDLLIDSAALAARVRRLALELTEAYEGRRPVLVSVLKGATLFLADLVRHMDIECEVDFMSISSFGSGGASGIVRIEQDLSGNIEGRHVVVVEDIVDTGLTLQYLLRVLAARHPASLEVCALFDKDVRRIVDLDIAFRGFSIPDRFVIGYGLDHDELYRNLDALYAVTDIEALVQEPARHVPSFFPAAGSGR